MFYYSLLIILNLFSFKIIKSEYNGIIQKERSLEIKLKPKFKRASIKNETLVIISLINKTNNTIKLKPQLNLGYQDGINRDLYLEIRKDGKLYEEYYETRADYDPFFLEYSEYINLKKDEKIEYVYDIQDLYPLNKKGKYKIRVLYDPNNDEYNSLNKIGVGIVSSNWVTFYVK